MPGGLTCDRKPGRAAVWHTYILLHSYSGNRHSGKLTCICMQTTPDPPHTRTGHARLDTRSVRHSRCMRTCICTGIGRYHGVSRYTVSQSHTDVSIHMHIPMATDRHIQTQPPRAGFRCVCSGGILHICIYTYITHRSDKCPHMLAGGEESYRHIQ